MIKNFTQEASEAFNRLSEIFTDYEKFAAWRLSDAFEAFRALCSRINTEDLYLGVTGSFSSGKSTFINSILRKVIMQ